MAEKHFKKVGLTPMQGFILMTIKKAPGIMISDLALVHQVVNSTITRMISALEAQGLVHKEEMGKVIRVFSTPEGDRKEADAKAAWKKLQFEYKQLIGKEEAQQLSDRITEALDHLKG